MKMIVHLHPEVFEIVESGAKDVEARVYDEKRRKLKIGDTLVFLKRPLEEEKIVAKVVDLKVFKNFLELGKFYEMKRLYLENYTLEMWLDILKQFYSEEEINKNGVVAIVFEQVK